MLIQPVMPFGPASAEPDLAAAQAQARFLASRIDALTTRAEVATEKYNAANMRLAGAVTESIQASERADALLGESREARDAATRRVSAIYRGGGSLTLYASVLEGSSPNDLLARLHTVQNLIDDGITTAAQADENLSGAVATKARLSELADTRAGLQREAEQARAEVVTLLAEQQRLLDTTNATIRRLVGEEQARRQQAAEASGRQALATAGTPVSDEAPGNPYAAVAIAKARTKLGQPYLWGGTGPDRFDCSGLTQWAYREAGLQIARVAADQWNSGPEVPLSALKPGDLMFWATNPANKRTIHHEAMYLGGGRMIESPHTGAFVRDVPIRIGSEYAGAVRPGVR
jgi:cell wall-associated NlpC family hydrolase